MGFPGLGPHQGLGTVELGELRGHWVVLDWAQDGKVSRLKIGKPQLLMARVMTNTPMMLSRNPARAWVRTASVSEQMQRAQCPPSLVRGAPEPAHQQNFPQKSYL